MLHFYKKSQIVNGGEEKKKAQSGRGMTQQEKSCQSARMVQPKKAQSGRSMMEMLGVLAIIGVLSIGSIAAYSAAMFKYQLNKFSESFSTLLHNAISLYPELQRQYGKGTTSNLFLDRFFCRHLFVAGWHKL